MNPIDLAEILKQFSGLTDALFGIPIVVVVWALTQGAKVQFSLTGKTVEYVSFGIGVVMGIGYKMTTGMEATFSWWFLSVVYGALLGVVPSLLYKTGQDAVKGAVRKSVEVNAGDVPKYISNTPPEILEMYRQEKK